MSQWVSQWAEFRTSVASRLASLLNSLFASRNSICGICVVKISTNAYWGKSSGLSQLVSIPRHLCQSGLIEDQGVHFIFADVKYLQILTKHWKVVNIYGAFVRIQTYGSMPNKLQFRAFNFLWTWGVQLTEIFIQSAIWRVMALEKTTLKNSKDI